ncbi:MAG: hypothetical protein WCX60_03720 [Anaerovoracaceae bacterium]
MKNFITNWTYRKHIVAETLCYASIALVGNAFFGKIPVKSEKSCYPIEVCKSMPKKQKAFNCMLISCMVVDFTASYFLLKGLKKIARNGTSK